MTTPGQEDDPNMMGYGNQDPGEGGNRRAKDESHPCSKNLSIRLNSLNSPWQQPGLSGRPPDSRRCCHTLHQMKRSLQTEAEDEFFFSLKYYSEIFLIQWRLTYLCFLENLWGYISRQRLANLSLSHWTLYFAYLKIRGSQGGWEDVKDTNPGTVAKTI